MAFDKRKALQSALTYTQQAKWDKAIAGYQAILKADPNDLTVCNNLGDLYARAGKPADAIEQYLKLGELYRTDGLAGKAIAVYKKIVKLDPTRTQALLACADLYEEQGLTGEAKIQLANAAEQFGKAGDTAKLLEIYQRLTALDPSNYGMLARFADLLLKEKRKEEAVTQSELAAQAAEAAGQAAESKRLLTKVRELSPESPHANLALAEQFLRESKYGEALEKLLKATAVDAGHAHAWQLLGEAYVGLGQASEAITALEQAMSLGVPQAEVRGLLAKALVQDGHTDEGIKLCQEITEDAIRRGSPDEAIAACRGLLEIAPHLTPVHAYMVRVLQDLGREEEAREATWALAAAYEAGGEIEAAIHAYHQLLERDPSDAEALARLEVLEGAAAMHGEQAAVAEVAGPTIEQGPGAELELALAAEEAAAVPEVGSTEPPAFELSLDETPVSTPGAIPEESSEVALATEPAMAFLDVESLAPPVAMSEGAADVQPTSLEAVGEIEIPGLELLTAEEITPEPASPEAPPAVEVPEAETGEVAEKLAEAEVYLNYGLTEKARERLLEVARIAPDHLGVHRRLKVVYLERSQVEEACQEIVTVVKILRAQGQPEAAQREVEEGLALAPGHPDLQDLLAELSGVTSGAAVMPPTSAEVVPAQVSGALDLEIPGAVEIGAGATVQGEVPMELETQFGLAESFGVEEIAPPVAALPEPAEPEMAPPEATPALEIPGTGGEETFEEAPSVTVDLGGGSGVEEEGLPAELQALLEEPEAEAPVIEVVGGEGGAEQGMADDLAEAEFYSSQGMVDEARAVLRRMQARDPAHPAVAQLSARLEPSPPAEPPAPAPVQSDEGALPVGEVQTAMPTVTESVSPEFLEFIPDLPPEGLPPEEGTTAPEPTQVLPEGSAQEAAVEASQPAWQPVPAAPEPPVEVAPLETATPRFSIMQGGDDAGAGEFVDLGAELQEELAAGDQAATAAMGMEPPRVEDLLKEFQKGVREQLDEKDYETHYNLGIAYKEMELHDEAIQEFRLAARDPNRTVACASLLGHCFLAKGDAEGAVREFLAGLEVKGYPREAYHSLRYDLAVAYETQGNLLRAVESFEVLQAENARFRDVAARLQALRGRVSQQVSVPKADVSAPESVTPRRLKEKKKISFIFDALLSRVHH
jgi:tetratricopeptide (TPR) repeat protein